MVGVLPSTQIHIKWEIVLQVQKCIHAVFRLSLFRGWYKVLTSFPEVWMKKNLMEFVVPLNGKQLPLAGLLSPAILKESNFVG